MLEKLADVLTITAALTPVLAALFAIMYHTFKEQGTKSKEGRSEEGGEWKKEFGVKAREDFLSFHASLYWIVQYF